MFFEFSQNNSGGSYDVDHKAGISQLVIIEADSAEEANSLAGSIGLYFDGNGDCPCCGDRWYPQWEGDKGTETPERYGSPVLKLKRREARDLKGTRFGGAAIYVHYKDGRIMPGKTL